MYFKSYFVIVLSVFFFNIFLIIFRRLFCHGVVCILFNIYPIYPKGYFVKNRLYYLVPFPMYSEGYFVMKQSVFLFHFQYILKAILPWHRLSPFCAVPKVFRGLFPTGTICIFFNRFQFILRDILSWNRLYSFCGVSNIFQLVPCHGIVSIVFCVVPKEFR